MHKCALACLLLSATTGAYAADAESESAVTTRIQLEAELADNPFVITPHRPTYLLPVTYDDNPPVGDDGEFVERWEMKFQVSFKVLMAKNLFGRDHVAFGYTQTSWWQAYNLDASAPFRETNHEPELMYTRITDFDLLGWANRVVVLGLSHQSNGQAGLHSRSWNRLYGNFVFERDRWYVSLKPWWRIPEPKKDDPEDPTGDDNPDIGDYMGSFELSGLYYQGDETYGLMLRNNLGRENRGAIRLDWTLPLTGRLRGYVQYFNGYGESLIDYDRYSNRIGVGVMLVNWL